MAGSPFDSNQPPFWYEAPDLRPELRDYVLACLRSARPSRLRTEAIDAFSRATPTGPLAPVDWCALESEAGRRGVTLADLIGESGSDGPDPFAR
jgi:hypothetical protein